MTQKTMANNKIPEKYSVIYFRVKEQFPNAGCSDIIDALDFIVSLGYDLNQLAFENVIHNVTNYLHKREKKKTNPKKEEKETKEKPKKDKSKNVNNCAICFEDMYEQTRCILKCRHIFHDKCIKEWLHFNHVCPNCRQLTILD